MMSSSSDWIQIVASNTSNPVMLSSLYVCNSIRKRESERSNEQRDVSKKCRFEFHPFLSKYVHDDEEVIHIDKGNIDQLRHELFKAVVDKDYDTINYMLHKVDKASVLWTSCDNGFENILHFSARTGQRNIIKLLLETDSSALLVNKELSTALHTASRVGHLEICEILLEYGSDINFRDDSGCTPLMLGVHSLEITELLLAHGCDVNLKDKYENSALIRACTGGHSSVVRVLLKEGADAKASDIYGYTALMMTVRHNDIPLLKDLLLYGSDPCAQSFSGITALHEAGFMANAYEIISELIKAGCHTDAKNSKGQTPLVYAIVMARPHNILCFIQSNCQVNFVFNMYEQSFTPFSLCLRDCLQIAERSQEYELNSLDKDNFCSLIFAMFILLMSGGKIIHSSIFGLKETLKILQNCFNSIYENSSIEKLNSNMMFIISSIENPLSLLQLSRIVIRKSLKKGIQLEDVNLKLPLVMKKYLLLIDHQYENTIT